MSCFAAVAGKVEEEDEAGDDDDEEEEDADISPPSAPAGAYSTCRPLTVASGCRS